MSRALARRFAAWIVPPRPRQLLFPRAWRTALAQASPHRRLAAAVGTVLVVGALLARHAFFIVTPWHVMSESLPEQWFFVRLHAPERLERGDYVAWRWHGPGLSEGALLIKRVAGVPGDRVTRTDAGQGRWHYYVNGTFAGTAKAFSRSGAPLAPGPLGTLPAGRYYVLGTHPDSLDSRYALAGWIPQARLLGRAYPLSGH